MVNEAIERYETILTNRIKMDKNRGKKISQHIKALKGDTQIKESSVYDENNKKLNINDALDILADYWPALYNKHPNEIPSKMTVTDINDYKIKFESENKSTFKSIKSVNIENGIFTYVHEDIELPSGVAEHYEYAMRVDRKINNMKYTPITTTDIKKQINKLRSGKAPGPDGLKPELYKYLQEDEQFLTIMKDIMNQIVSSGHIPSNWSLSNTKLIPKNKNPKAKEFRPIALTDITYKILMGILKDKIEYHINVNNFTNELQCGATKGRRPTENLFILRY